ncbi:MAG: hypothetical protein WBG41_01700 [Acidimicrobiales bacterium]
MKNKLLVIIATAALVVVCGACTADLTPDGTPYTFTNPSPGEVIVTAAPTAGGNNREAFWSANAPTEPDPVVCATFASGTGLDQQGIVLRREGEDELTVTRNVIYDDFQTFNFHIWSGPTYTLFAQFSLTFLPYAPATYPLNICATITGDTMEFVVWTAGQTQPPWGSTTQGGSATLPASAPPTGQEGWFAGHIVPGTSSTYTNLTVDGVPLTGGV